MREILFRGKPTEPFKDFLILRKEYCEEGFVTGSLVLAGENRAYICVGGFCSSRSIINNGITTMVEVIPETIGQFTGLLDKNGKKIFEGDILRAQVCKYDKPEFYAVEWWNESCGFEPLSDSKENCGHCGGGWNTNWVEVVGNIHDNPELLEVKK